ncbi:transposase [Chloroflexota bacterium]
MDLTDQQWHLVQPIINDHFPHPTPRSLEVGGRPPIDPRPVLDAILWKIRNNAPWYDLPKRYPSHQTAYRRYHLWKRTGLLNQVFHTLFDDLLQRGQFDPRLALRTGAITVTFHGNRYRILSATELLDTWQLSTALVLIQLAISHLRVPKELPS